MRAFLVSSLLFFFYGTTSAQSKQGNNWIFKAGELFRFDTTPKSRGSLTPIVGRIPSVLSSPSGELLFYSSGQKDRKSTRLNSSHVD